MRTNLRSKFSKLLAGDSTAAEVVFWTDSLLRLPSWFAVNESLKGTLARLSRYGEEFIIQLLDLDNFKVVKDRSVRFEETAASLEPAIMINNAEHAPTSPQPSDLHDVTGHHRYYGSTACNVVAR